MTQAVIAYVPAVHAGYLAFFREHPGPAYLLGPEFIAEIPRLDRDLRALPPDLAAAALSAAGISPETSVLSQESLARILAERPRVIMPDEDTSRTFAAAHLDGLEVSFEKAFLRWDKQITLGENAVAPDRTISESEADRELMHAASAEASRSRDWWRQVGALAARGGKVIMTTHNEVMPSEDYSLSTFGDPRSNVDAGEHIDLAKAIHAEALLIAKAARGGLALDGADLYATTFPCAWCAKEIVQAGFRRVYYRDGYSRLDGEDVMKGAGIEVVLVR